MYCERCGSPLKDDAKFCTGCGNRVDSQPVLTPSAYNAGDGVSKTEIKHGKNPLKKWLWIIGGFIILAAVSKIIGNSLARHQGIQPLNSGKSVNPVEIVKPVEYTIISDDGGRKVAICVPLLSSSSEIKVTLEEVARTKFNPSREFNGHSYFWVQAFPCTDDGTILHMSAGERRCNSGNCSHVCYEGVRKSPALVLDELKRNPKAVKNGQARFPNDMDVKIYEAWNEYTYSGSDPKSEQEADSFISKTFNVDKKRIDDADMVVSLYQQREAGTCPP